MGLRDLDHAMCRLQVSAQDEQPTAEHSPDSERDFIERRLLPRGQEETLADWLIEARLTRSLNAISVLGTMTIPIVPIRIAKIYYSHSESLSNGGEAGLV